MLCLLGRTTVPPGANPGAGPSVSTLMAAALGSLTMWYLILMATCVLAPYALGIQPRRRRDWLLLSGTLGFLTWLLAGFVSLRS